MKKRFLQKLVAVATATTLMWLTGDAGGEYEHRAGKHDRGGSVRV